MYYLVGRKTIALSRLSLSQPPLQADNFKIFQVLKHIFLPTNIITRHGIPVGGNNINILF
jgi:hypothetical protein